MAINNPSQDDPTGGFNPDDPRQPRRPVPPLPPPDDGTTGPASPPISRRPLPGTSPNSGDSTKTGAPSNDWTWGDDETQALLAALNAGQSGQGFLDAYNTHFKLQPGGSLAYYQDQNIYALPSGYATKGPNGWTWNVRGGGGGGAAPTTAPTIGPSPFAAGDAQRQAQADALFSQLMGRAQQSENITASDPIIKGQVDAHAATAADQWRNTMSQLAEHGGANFNPDAEARSVGENLAKDTANFQSQLMNTELQSRRDQINQALTQAAGLLTAEQQMALQDELHRLDAMIGDSQFTRNLGERAFEFDSTVNP